MLRIPSSARPRADLPSVYRQVDPAARGLVARSLMPSHSVPAMRGVLFVLAADATLLDPGPSVDRERLGQRASLEYGVGSVEYRLVERSIEVPVDLRDLADYADQDPGPAAMRIAAATLDTRMERLVAGALANDADYPATPAAAAWGSGSSATPVTDVLEAVDRLRALRGDGTTALVVTRGQRLALSRSAEVAGMLQHSSLVQGRIPDETLAAVCGVDRVYEAGATVLASAPRANGSTGTIAGIWGEDRAYVVRVADSDNAPIDSAAQWGRTLELDGEAGLVAYEYEAPGRNAVIYVAEQLYQPFVVDRACVQAIGVA